MRKYTLTAAIAIMTAWASVSFAQNAPNNAANQNQAASQNQHPQSNPQVIIPGQRANQQSQTPNQAGKAPQPNDPGTDQAVQAGNSGTNDHAMVLNQINQIQNSAQQMLNQLNALRTQLAK